MDNPYRPPDANLISAGDGGSGSSDIGPDWDAFQVLQMSWDRVRENPGPMVGAAAIMFGISLVFSMINQVISIGLPIFAQTSGSDIPSYLAFLLTIPLTLVSMAVQMFLLIGQFRICLGVVRRQPVTLGMLFSGGPWALPVFGGSILLGIAVTLGFFLLIVPGAILALGTSMWMYLVIDRDMGVIDAFQTSWQITDGEKMKLLVLGLIAGMGGLVAVCCTCGFGVVVLYPMLYTSAAIVYDYLVRTKLSTT